MENKKYNSLLICMALILVIVVGSTIGLTMAIFGDVKQNASNISLGASIYFDGEKGISFSNLSSSAVVPGQTVDIETELVIKAGETGKPVPAVLRATPTLVSDVKGVTMYLTQGQTFPVKINGTTSTDAVMVVYRNILYLVYADDTTKLYEITPTTSGLTISFTTSVNFSLNISSEYSGKKSNVKIKAVVVQSEIYDKTNTRIPLNIPYFKSYFENFDPVLYDMEEDKYIYFGEFPQTIKSANVTITSDSVDSNGYYTGSDGEKYAKVIAKIYSNDSAQASDGTTMVTGTEYYFKVEPIKWRILSNSNGTALITSDTILQGMAYQSHYTHSGSDYYATDASGNILTDNGEQVYANNYKWSELRAFLTGDFYTKSFTSDQKSLIQLTEVDNSVSTTYAPNSTNPYTCEDTEDYVFALSYADLINTSYGFNSDRSTVDSARIWKTTDYAKATNVLTYTKEYLIDTIFDGTEPSPDDENYDVFTFIDGGDVWLRSPCYYNSKFAAGLMECLVYYGNGVAYLNGGAVPALNIYL